MPLVVALRPGLFGSAFREAGDRFEISDDGVLESRLQAKDVRLATDADLVATTLVTGNQGGADAEKKPPRVEVGSLEDLPTKTIKILHEAGFQFVDELTEASLTGKPGIGEATRLSILAAVTKMTAATAG